ncbi:MAG: hypothetical protein J5J06_04060 [Phycisphaerae bacterium]|nr:hypothetical protein [Phycisphaerae bacterium]
MISVQVDPVRWRPIIWTGGFVAYVRMTIQIVVNLVRIPAVVAIVTNITNTVAIEVGLPPVAVVEAEDGSGTVICNLVKLLTLIFNPWTIISLPIYLILIRVQEGASLAFAVIPVVEFCGV